MPKTIGILGGLSPESSVEYYLHITRSYTARFGDYAYPQIVLYSVSFQPYVDWPAQNRWDLIAAGLAQAAQKLEASGVDCILIAANTMHLVYDQVQSAVRVPVISLVECVAAAVQAQGLTKVALLGTRFTMEKPLYQPVLARRGIQVLLPEPDERTLVSRVIYEELVAGKLLDTSRAAYVEIIQHMVARGAQGVILGCTEIPQLIHPQDVSVPLFDTTTIHADAALAFALKDA
jgi:aspartate racemase